MMLLGAVLLRILLLALASLLLPRMALSFAPEWGGVIRTLLASTPLQKIISIVDRQCQSTKSKERMSRPQMPLRNSQAGQ